MAAFHTRMLQRSFRRKHKARTDTGRTLQRHRFRSEILHTLHHTRGIRVLFTHHHAERRLPMKKREARKAINGYFGEIRHSIMFTVTRHGVLAYVEYEDFMPEHTVRRELESLLGSGYLVSVKRECSRSLFKEIVDFLSSDTSGQKTLLMMMGNYVSAHPLHNSL